MIKKCLICQLELNISLFNKKSGRVNQWMSYCKECYKQYRHQQYSVTKEHEKKVRATWYASNKDSKREYERAFRKEYYKQNPNFRLGLLLRIRIKNALKKQLSSQSGQIAIDNLGCTTEELKKHLESQFKPGMSWDNWALHGWHIDHIKPLSLFDLSDPVQQKEACHYTNLQPLWAEDNLRKGDSYAK